jgi:mono/diheme cytochrome c family protein
MKKTVGFIIGVAGGGVVFLLAAYHVLIYYDNNFRYGRMRETPAVKPHEQPILIVEEGIVPISGGEAVLRVEKGAKLSASVNMTDSRTIARGKAVYTTFCIQCHAANHDGNGTVGQSFHPLPSDLRAPDVQNKAAGELFQSVSYGIPGGRQPPLQTTITINDRWRVVAYVMSLGIRN